MNTISACPARATLEEYLLGRMSDATAASVETHLSSCPGCRKRLPTIRAEDDFVADFRAHPTADAAERPARPVGGQPARSSGRP